MPEIVNTKLIEVFNSILPSIDWPTDVQPKHLQVSRILIAIAEQLDEAQQELFSKQMTDTSTNSAQIANWLSNQLPQITLILREIVEKNALATGILQS